VLHLLSVSVDLCVSVVSFFLSHSYHRNTEVTLQFREIVDGITSSVMVVYRARAFLPAKRTQRTQDSRSGGQGCQFQNKNRGAC